MVKKDNSNKEKFVSAYKKARKIKNIIGLVFVVLTIIAVIGFIYAILQLENIGSLI